MGRGFVLRAKSKSGVFEFQVSPCRPARFIPPMACILCGGVAAWTPGGILSATGSRFSCLSAPQSIGPLLGKRRRGKKAEKMGSERETEICLCSSAFCQRGEWKPTWYAPPVPRGKGFTPSVRGRLSAAGRVLPQGKQGRWENHAPHRAATTVGMASAGSAAVRDSNSHRGSFSMSLCLERHPASRPVADPSHVIFRFSFAVSRFFFRSVPAPDTHVDWFLVSCLLWCEGEAG